MHPTHLHLPPTLYTVRKALYTPLYTHRGNVRLFSVKEKLNTIKEGVKEDYYDII